MEFYDHWARVRTEVSTPRGMRSVTGVGWSNESEARAREMAERNMAASTERIMLTDPPRQRSYGYDDGRPLREQILHKLNGADGSLLAVITRNGYGSLVLNTRRVMFIDLDFQNVAPVAAPWWQRWWGSTPSDQERALAHVQRVAEDYPQWSFRVYRTAAGLRIVLLTQTVDATASRCFELLDAFGSDPLYVKLCRSQGSFRARLTPKAWRCGYMRPWGTFPFEDERARATMDRWLRGYEKVCDTHAACHLLTTIGVEQMPDEIRRVLALHDEHAQNPALPLA